MMREDIDIKGTIGAMVLFTVIALAGAVIAYASVKNYALARSSASWPVVEGVVLSDGANERTVRYSFFDGDRTRTGTRVRFWTGALSPTGDDYPPGARVSVHVSPRDGRTAVLEPGGDAPLFGLALLFGGVLVFLGVAGLVRLAMIADGLVAHDVRAAFEEDGLDFVPAE